MNDFDVAIAVADAGAAVVRRRFGTMLQCLDKGADDFATNVDIEAENAMLAVFHRERPAEDTSMKCAVCGGQLRSGHSDLPFKVSEQTIVILKQLPAAVCELYALSPRGSCA